MNESMPESPLPPSPLQIVTRAHFLRGWGEAEGRNIAIAVRIIIASLLLVLTVLDAPPTGAAMLLMLTLSFSYLTFSLSLGVARAHFWVADLRLGRMAPFIDETACAVVTLMYADRPAIYVPFALFLFASPLGRFNSWRLFAEFILLLALVPAHGALAGIVGIIPVVPAQALSLQFVLLLVVGLAVSSTRLGRPSFYSAVAVDETLLQIALDDRFPPLDLIADVIVKHLGAEATMFCWRTDDRPKPECVVARQGRLARVSLDEQAFASLVAPPLGHQCYLYDPANGYALISRTHARARLAQVAGPVLPDEVSTGTEGICGLPIKAGNMTGYALAIGIGKKSEPVLRLAERVAHTMNLLLSRHDLLVAWRQRAVADARLAMSRDMHDSVLQTLAGLRLRIVTMLQRSALPPLDELQKQLGELQSIIAAEQACLRGLLIETAKPEGDRINLIEHLEQRLELLSLQWGVKCSFDSFPADPLLVSSDMSIEIEFLVREAVSNAVQHAHATRLGISIATDDDQFVITIKTDGTSAHLLQPADSSMETIASRSIERRLAMLGGKAYEDPTNKGALLSIRLPVEEFGFGATVDRR